METCQLSRWIAQKSYPSLVAGLPCPVYINPAVDFLYCTSTLILSNNVGRIEDLPVFSILDTSSNVFAIQFLILDLVFWNQRMATSPLDTCPIPELRLFSSLEELLFIVPSLEQWLESRKRILAAFTHIPDDPRLDINTGYAAECARDETAPDAIVPTFRLYREGFDNFRNMELQRCFGVQEQDQQTLNLNVGPPVENANSGTVLPVNQSPPRRIPKWTEIRAKTK
jgi:hypothetical protein